MLRSEQPLLWGGCPGPWTRLPIHKGRKQTSPKSARLHGRCRDGAPTTKGHGRKDPVTAVMLVQTERSRWRQRGRQPVCPGLQSLGLTARCVVCGPHTPEERQGTV